MLRIFKIVISVYLIFYLPRLYACDCNSVALSEAYATSDLVVHAKILSEDVEFLSQSDAYLDSLSRHYDQSVRQPVQAKVYRVLVLHNYKSNMIGDTIVIRTNANSNCQITLQVEQNYILFARTISNLDWLFDSETNASFFQTSQCSATAVYHKKMSRKLVKMASMM